MAKLFKNPRTGEAKTACQWAIELEHSGSGAFRSYYKKWNDRGQPEKAFATLEERKKIYNKDKARPARKCYNPFEDETGTAKYWAKKQGCTVSHFNRKFRERGPNDPSTWQTLGEDQKVTSDRFDNRGNKEWLEMKGRGRKKIFNPGTLESRYLPDRWAHLTGEP